MALDLFALTEANLAATRSLTARYCPVLLKQWQDSGRGLTGRLLDSFYIYKLPRHQYKIEFKLTFLQEIVFVVLRGKTRKTQ